MTDATPGQKLDVDIAELRVEIEKLKAAASNDWSKIKAAVKANIPHYISWAGIGALVADKLGVLHL